MSTFSIFLVLITIVCFLLIIVIMVQNPKGGGLAGNVAGISNQFMGVKQTTDVLEKGTWIFAGVIGGLISFGLIGLFIGPVMLAVTYTLVKEWVNAGESAQLSKNS